MSENILFGEYGRWITEKFDAKATEITVLADSLTFFDYALIKVFICFILVKKGYEIALEESEPLGLKSSDFLNSSKCIETIIKIKKEAFYLLRESPYNYADYMPGESNIYFPGLELKSQFRISWLYNEDKELEDYGKLAEVLGERYKVWFLQIIEKLKQKAESNNKVWEEEETSILDVAAATEVIQDVLPEKNIINENKKENVKKIINLFAKHGFISPYVFVDPRIVDRNAPIYLAIKERLRDEYGWDLLKTDEDLINEFIGSNKISEVQKEWETIRNKAIEQVKKETPLPLSKLNEEEQILELIRQGESKKLEFKQTFSKDVDTGISQKQPNIREASLKTIVGFLNTDGGTLLIGVKNNSDIFGIENDNYENDDKYLLNFKNNIRDHIGLAAFHFVEYKIVSVENKKILRVDCKPSTSESFLDDKDFYVRINPSTEKIVGSKLLDYISRRFNK